MNYMYIPDIKNIVFEIVQHDSLTGQVIKTHASQY